MIVDVTVKCEEKDKFIQKILQLDETIQMGLMNCIQNNELLLKLTKEQSSLDDSVIKEKDNSILHFLSFHSKSNENASQSCSFSNIEKINLNVSFNSSSNYSNQSFCEEDGKFTLEAKQKLQNRVKALERENKISKNTQNDLLIQIKELNDLVTTLNKEKKRLARENETMSPSKSKQPKMSKEALNFISELEMELDRAKTEIIELKDKNEASERLYSKYFEDNYEGGYYLNERLNSLVTENDSLKSKIVDLQSKASLSEAYKKKLEDVIEYKHRYESLENENEDLKSEIFDLELKLNKEIRFEEMYNKTKEELFSLKSAFNTAELDLKSVRAENKGLKGELERMSKTNKTQESHIKQLEHELSLLKKESLQDSMENGILEINMHYEEKIRVLEEEVEELRIENENYANNEIIKLEEALSNQEKEVKKTQEEKGYFEERCNLLEKQNNELKNRINNLKQDSLTSRNRLLKNDNLVKTNQKLSLKLENFEERLSLENTKIQLIQGENKNLK